MGWVVLLLVLALVLGGVGALVEGLMWLLVIAAVLFVAGTLLGVTGRSSRRSVSR
jgi:hypothetical protein